MTGGRFVERAVARAKEVGTPAQVKAAEDLFAGRVDTEQKMRDYFATMGNLYARVSDPVLSGKGLESIIMSPDAINAAHGPGGFLRTMNLAPELGKITAPTLILAGRHDWICPPEQVEEIQRMIPGAELRIFEESAHQMPTDEPEKFLDVIRGFLVYNQRKQ